MNPRILMAALLICSAPAFGQKVYKCPGATPGAPPTFQQTRCPTKGGEKIVVDAPQASGPGGLRLGEKWLLRDAKSRLPDQILERDVVNLQMQVEDR